ncbi:MAG: GDYXXLXY domain-containing protein [Elusimicrobia bacterium]|nr:GDYXXLXY domain-containing protein [Elusimicrobiota bacterium]
MTRTRIITFWLIAGFQIIIVLVMVGLKQSIVLYGKTIILKSQPVDPHSLFQGDYAQLSYAINTVEIQKSTGTSYDRGDKIYTELALSGTFWNFVSVHSEIPESLSDDHVILEGIVKYQSQHSGYPVSELKDFSNPGWLNIQPATATWRQNWSWGPFGRQDGLWYNYGRKGLSEGTSVFIYLYSYDDGKSWNFSQISESSTTIHSQYAYNIILSGKLGPYKEQNYLSVNYGIESYFIPEGKGRTYERGGLDVEIAVNRKGKSVIKNIILLQ